MRTASIKLNHDDVVLLQSLSVFQRFCAVVEAYGEKTAVIIDAVEYDYDSLLKHVTACAQELLEKGVGEGDVVALVLPNSFDFVVITIATMAINAVLLPLNPRLKPEELQQYLHLTSPKVVFLPPDLRRSVEDMQLNAVLAESFSGVAGKGRTLKGLSQNDAACLPALYMFSSGSTGKSKRITRTQQQVMSEYYALEQTIALKPSDCILCTIPLFHAHGFGNTLVAALMTGSKLVILTQEFSARATVRAMQAQRVTIYPAVPFMFKMIVDTHFKAKPDFDLIRLLVSAGAQLPKDVAEAFFAAFSKPICQLYGSSETGAVCSNLHHPVNKCLSVGRPLKGMAIDILDDHGNRVACEQEGEIWISSPAMTHQYDDLVKLTKECFVENRFFAGDIGYVDAQGDLFITGRKKLMINVAGYKVDPLEIERILKSHPAIDDAVVIGVADPHYGELIKAVVVCSQRDDCSEQKLIAYAASHLAEYKLPRVVEFRDDIPRSPLGKVLRKYLQ